MTSLAFTNRGFSQDIAARNATIKNLIVDNTFYNPEFTNLESTGYREGGIISVDPMDNTMINVTSGFGIVVDNATNPLQPTRQIVNWNAFNNVPIQFLTTSQFSNITINAQGQLIQSPVNVPGNTIRRNEIVLGRLNHPHGTLLSVVNYQHPIYDVRLFWEDLVHALGEVINETGNIFGPASNNLTMIKSSGRTFKIGTNILNNKKDPHVTNDPTLNPVNFVYEYRDGSGGWIIETMLRTDIDPNNFDDGSGVLQPVPVGRYSNQILLYDNSTQSVIVKYAQFTYANIQDAIDGIIADPLIANPFDVGYLSRRAILIVLQGATDLSNLTQARFVELDKFGNVGAGGGAAGSTATLQVTYGNSTVPQIVLDAPDILTIRDNAVPIGTDLFRIQDNGGTTEYLAVSATGASVDGTLTSTGNGTFGGVNVSSHGSRHLPSGADALTTAAPTTTLDTTTMNAEGVANSFARSDHTHEIDFPFLQEFEQFYPVSSPAFFTGIELATDGNPLTSLLPGNLVFSVTTASKPIGTYRIGWQFDWSGSANRDFIAELQVDSVIVQRFRQQPSNTSGTGTGTNSMGASANADNRNHVCTFLYSSFVSAATHVIRMLIAYEPGGGNPIVGIDQARIEIWRVA